tara:strand:+ start:83 stop:724 length:642 start_codon:yes stop_codon:yes gene_type:complete
MSIKFKKPVNEKNDFLIPSGTHIARCYKMIHIGERNYEYNGEPKTKNSLWVFFELPFEMRVFDPNKGEQPMSISIEYNLTYYETAKLFKHINSWRGKTLTPQEIDGFEVDKLLGVPCSLSIVHNTSLKNGKIYANIQSVSGIPKGMECPNQINDTLVWDYEDNFSLDVFNSFHSFFQNMIKETPEWKKRNIIEADELISDEDINNNKPNDLPF